MSNQDAHQADPARADAQDPSASTAPAAEGGAQGPGPATLGFLGQIQSQLESLSGLIAQQSQREADLAVREAEIARKVAAAETRESDLNRRIAEFDEQMQARAAELDARLASAEEDTARRDRDAAAREAAIAEARAGLDHQSASRTAALDEREAALAARDAELARRDAEMADRERALRDREAEHAKAAGQAREAGEAAAASRDAQVADLQGQLEHARGAEAALIAERDEARRAADEARRAADQARQAADEASAALAASEEQRRADAAARDAERAASAAAEPPPSDMTQRVEDLLQAIEQRDEALRRAIGRVQQAEALEAELRSQVQALAERVEGAGAPSDPASDGPASAGGDTARAALRRERLARYKSLLQAQSGKIVKAKAALQKRTAECEQILAQRASLAEAGQALEAERRAVAAKAARSGAAMIAAASVVSLAVIGGLAWGVARQIAPAEFAARAEITADGRGRDLSPDEVASWTQTHKDLVQDPQVISSAAENFSRRGMGELGTIAAVKMKVAGTLYVKADAPGVLVLEHRAPGAERSARELETFLSALLAVSNGQRENRGDGAATIVSSPPTPGLEPIESQRLVYSAAIAGGGVLVALAAGLLGYRALSRAKARVEDALAGPATLV